MNFFIEYFNSIVGALAAIGAVASIYYLIQEMREQNRVARANARQNVADSHQEIALEKCIIIEASSPHLNDRVRVEKFFGMNEKGLPTTQLNEIIKL